MPGFRSAELKQAAEELWEGGVRVSASQLARLYRAGELTAILAAYRQARAEAESLRHRREFLERMIPQWEAARAAYEAELRRTEQRRQELINERQRLTAWIASAESEARHLSQQMDTLRTRMWALQAEIANLYRQLQTLHRLLQTVPPGSAPWYSYQYAIQTTERQIREAEAQLDQLQNELEALHSRWHTLRQWIAQANTAVEALTKEIDALLSAILALEKEVEALHEQISRARQELERIARG